jgi:hypothetical protein
VPLVPLVLTDRVRWRRGAGASALDGEPESVTYLAPVKQPCSRRTFASAGLSPWGNSVVPATSLEAVMVSTDPSPTPVKARRRSGPASPAARRFGYLIAIAINALIWYLLFVAPGWAAVPFLTGAAREVLALVGASLIVGMVANIAYLISDDWPRVLGEPITTAVGVAAMIRIWQVFPFDFGASSSSPLIARWLLGLAIAFTIVALIVQVVVIVRRAAGRPPAYRRTKIGR